MTVPRRATIVDLARHAGVSKSTVSLVLNASPLVGAEKRARVERAIEALGYIYDRRAASLRARPSDVIGMVINDLGNPFFAEMARGIERAAAARGVTPFLANSGEDPIRQEALARAMFERGAVGFILSPATGTGAEAIGRMVAWGAPVVLASRGVECPGASVVVPDNGGGAAAAVAHLAALGHRRIAFLGGRPGMVARDERLAGYRRGLTAAGIAAEAGLEVESEIDRAGGLAAFEAAAGAAPTAALCFNDRVAIGALHGLAARGMRAGADFALVGFDDIAEARWTVPPLTTVAVDAAGLGARAAALLFAGLDGAAASRMVTPTRLVVRGSCGGMGDG